MKQRFLKISVALATLASPVVAFAANTTTTPPPKTPIVSVSPSGDLQTIAQSIIGVLLVLAGALAVIFLIIGGIRYLISSGDSGQIEKAKHTIQYAIIGLVVIIFAYVIVNSVIKGAVQ